MKLLCIFTLGICFTFATCDGVRTSISLGYMGKEATLSRGSDGKAVLDLRANLDK